MIIEILINEKLKDGFLQETSRNKKKESKEIVTFLFTSFSFYLILIFIK